MEPVKVLIEVRLEHSGMLIDDKGNVYGHNKSKTIRNVSKLLKYSSKITQINKVVFLKILELIAEIIQQEQDFKIISNTSSDISVNPLESNISEAQHTVDREYYIYLHQHIPLLIAKHGKIEGSVGGSSVELCEIIDVYSNQVTESLLAKKLEIKDREYDDIFYVVKNREFILKMKGCNICQSIWQLIYDKTVFDRINTGSTCSGIILSGQQCQQLETFIARDTGTYYIEGASQRAYGGNYRGADNRHTWKIIVN